MKKLIAFLCLCVSGACLYAQQPAVAPSTAQIADQVPKEEQATREDVLALMEVMHSRRGAQAGMDLMADQMKKGARASFLHQYPHASQGVLNKMDGIFAGSMKVVSLDDILANMVPVYQKYLSHEDAISLISFYSSPAGQRYLERMPALLKEIGDMSSKLVVAHMDEIQASTQKGMQEFQKYIAAHPDEVGAPAAPKQSVQ